MHPGPPLAGPAVRTAVGTTGAAARELATSSERTHRPRQRVFGRAWRRMVTVRGPGLSVSLERGLTTTNPMDSMIFFARTTQLSAT